VAGLVGAGGNGDVEVGASEEALDQVDDVGTVGEVHDFEEFVLVVGPLGVLVLVEEVVRLKVVEDGVSESVTADGGLYQVPELIRGLGCGGRLAQGRSLTPSSGSVG